MYGYLTFALYAKTFRGQPGYYCTNQVFGLYNDPDFVNQDIIGGARITELNDVFKKYAIKYNKEYYLEAYSGTNGIANTTFIRVRDSVTDEIVGGTEGRFYYYNYDENEYHRYQEGYDSVHITYDDVKNSDICYWQQRTGSGEMRYYSYVTSGFDDVYKIFDQSTI